MIDWLLYSKLINLTFSILTALIFYMLWLSLGRRYMLTWALGWLSYALGLVFDYLRLVQPALSPTWIYLMAFWFGVSGGIILLGAFHFTGTTSRWLKLWWTVPLFALLAGIGIAVFTRNAILAGAPAMFVLGLSHLAMGIFIFRWKDFKFYWVRYLLGTSLVLSGLHLLDYPFLSGVGWFAPFGYIFAAVLNIFIAIGFLTLSLQYMVENLKESRDSFKQLIDNAADAIFLIDSTGRILDVNRAACDSLGYARSELLSLFVFDIVTTLREQDPAGVLRNAQDGQTVVLESLHRRKNGCFFPVETHIRKLEGAKNTLLIAISRDISERKAFEETLKNTNETLNAIFQASPYAIIALDAAAKISLWNETAEEILGWSKDEVIGMPLPDIPPEKREEAERFFREGLAGASLYNLQTKRLKKNGRLLDVSISMAPMRDAQDVITGVVAIVADITRMKLAEVEKEQVSIQRNLLLRRYQTVLEHMPVGCVTCDADLFINYWNPAAEKILGYSLEDVLGKTPDEVFAFFSTTTLDETDRMLPEGQQKLQTENITKDGRKIICEWRITPLHDENGLFAGYLSMFFDATERIRAEMALKESEERYRSLVELAPDAIYIFQDRKIVYINPAGARMFRAPGPEALEGYPLEKIVHPDDWTQSEQRLEGLFSGETRFSQVENRYVRLDGSDFPVEVHASLVTYKGQPTVQVIARDITERKRLENERVHYSNQLKLLAETSLKMNAQYTLGEVMDLAAMAGREMIAARYSMISLARDTDGIQELGAVSLPETENPQMIERFRLAWVGSENEFIHAFYRAKQPLILTREQMEGFSLSIGEPFTILQEGRTMVNGCLVIPLVGQDGNNLGLYHLLDKTDGGFNEDDRSIMLQLAQMVSVAIEKTSLIEAINRANRHMHTLAQQVISAQEKERLTISRELHDESGQVLTALKLNLQMISEDIPAELTQLQSGIEDSIHLIDSAMQKIRDLTHELRPPRLEFGLNASLEGMCSDFSKRLGIPVAYMGSEVKREENRIGVTIYRLLQEAFTNIARHAHAANVWVTLKHDAALIELTIRDDGVGFDKNTAGGAGIGLLNMEERLGLLNGKLIISSEVGRGTTLTARIPWEGQV